MIFFFLLHMRKHEERNKDMARGMYRRKDNLNRNKQNIQVKMSGPTVLKLIMISVHSQLETKQRENRIQNCGYRGTESPQMHPRVGRES